MNLARNIANGPGDGVEVTPFGQYASLGIGDLEVDPDPHEIERAGNEVVTHFFVLYYGHELQFAARLHLLGCVKADSGDGPLRPKVLDFGDDSFSLDPFASEFVLGFPVREFEDGGHVEVGRDGAVVAVGLVVGVAPGVPGFAAARIEGVPFQAHMAVAAGQVLVRIVLNVPMTFAPLVELVLAGAEAKAVEGLGDELLVAGTAEFGGAQQVAIVVLEVFARVSADEEIGEELAGAAGCLADVFFGRCQDVIGVTPLVHLGNGVAHHAGVAFLHARRGEVHVLDVLSAGKEGDGIVAAGAIAGFGGRAVLGEGLLHSLEGRIHGGEAVGAGLPFGQDLLVAAGGAAGFGVGQDFGVDQHAVISTGVGGGKRVAAVLVEFLGEIGQAIIFGDGQVDLLFGPGQGDAGNGDSRYGEQYYVSADKGMKGGPVLKEVDNGRLAPGKGEGGMGDKERQGSQAGDQVEQVPGLAGAEAENGLPGQDQATEDAKDKDGHQCIA